MKVTLSSHCKNLKPGWDQPENGKQFLRHGIGQQQQHAIMYTASFRHRFNSVRSTIDPLIDGVTPLPLSLPFHFPLEHKPHSLYCSFLTSIYFVLSPFLSASTLQMREALLALLACLCGLVSASLCQGFLWKVRAAAFSKR